MARIAFVCPDFYSHLRAFEALGEELASMGHEPVFLVPEGAGEMRSTHFRTIFVGRKAGGVFGRRLAGRAAASGTGLTGILRTVADRARATDAFCAAAPAVMRRERIDLVVGDEFEPAAGLVAAFLGLPHVSLAAALPIERDPAMPLPFLGWAYDPSERGLARNRGGELVGGFLMGSQRRVISRWAQRFGLGEIADDTACLSRSLRLAQAPASFDFPRPPTAGLTPVGPIRSQHREAHPGLDAFAVDPARPFVFASLGTMQGHRRWLFERIASVCRAAGAQLLVAHCGGLSPSDAARIGADWVTDFVDQGSILSRADLCVTHGGLNTVLDCIDTGTPMLALPVGYDQPGNGARIRHHRIGETIPARRATRRRIEEALTRLLDERAGYVERAAPMRAEIRRAGGAARAAQLVHDLLIRSRIEAHAGRFDAARQPANDTEIRDLGLSVRL
ncbi:glycosyltransferase [Fulvimarina endophytica]|uniref:glycosyltransferase n=1 Tax=Fulvimarina endophytica TaxID=2293836 RepID=UPI001314D12A|nr:glycosyltransferase [Fulvimarina endophytica]